MIKELEAVEKFIKDRLTEKSTDFVKHVWKEKDKETKNYFFADSYMGRAHEIELYSRTLSIIQDEIRTLQAHKNG